MKDLSTSIVRTVVPYLLGLIVSLATAWGLHLSVAVQAYLDGLLTFGVGSVYYLVVRWLETKYPQLGWLLGTPTPPVYTK